MNLHPIMAQALRPWMPAQDPRESLQLEADDDDDLDPDNPDDEHGICPTCSGSGEGMHEGTRCHACKGRGEV